MTTTRRTPHKKNHTYFLYITTKQIIEILKQKEIHHTTTAKIDYPPKQRMYKVLFGASKEVR
jgi:hypothetical protein